MFTSPHEIELMKKIVVGRGVRRNVPSYLKELGNWKRVLLLTGPHVWEVAGKEIKEYLEDSGFDVQVDFVKEATVNESRRIKEAVEETKSEVIIGVGGGKVIDVAKYAARLTNKPMISVPTAASHDGIASPFASLKGTNRPTSVKAVVPLAVVADIEVIERAPKKLLLAGVGDIIGKFTAVLDWRLAHRLKGEYYGAYAANLALMSAKHVIAHADLIKKGGEEGVRVVVEALISSSVAMCIAGSTRPASGSEHLFSHALDILAPKPAMHGHQVAVGTIMMLYLHGKKWKRIRNILKMLGVPTTAKELGVPDDVVVDALTIAHTIRPERYTILGERGLTKEAAERLARATGVID